MLDKLVVSKNSAEENKRIVNFLITSFLAITSVLTVGLVYSLFSYNLAMASDDLNVSTLIAPVIETEAEPEINKQESRPEKSNPTVQKEITRTTNTQRLEETPVKAPDKISVIPSNVKSRPTEPFRLGTFDSGESTASAMLSSRGEKIGANSNGINKPADDSKTPEISTKKPEIDEPPKLEFKPVEKKEPKTISGGVVNGKAIDLAQPVYTPAARSMNVSGKVTVQVLIDEDGNVVSAKAVDGHPLLRQSAVSAARISKFTPTYLSKQKVKVSGVIVYNFIR